jgi:hypothetical protein
MFDLGPDPLAEELEKPPEASWIVAPLVASAAAPPTDIAQSEHPFELVGYLAADNVPEELDFEDEAERNWLQCGLSVIAVAATMALQAFDAWKPPLRD